MSESQCLLTINAGSSSIKFALFEASDEPQRTISGQLERIGTPDSAIAWADARAERLAAAAAGGENQRGRRRTLRPLARRAGGTRSDSCGRAPSRSWRSDLLAADAGDAGGHRRVGPNQPARSEHLPAEIELIEAFSQHLPNVPQVLCFDTAFHHDLPRVSRLLPVPRRFEAQGVRRYGFHGLSYTFLLSEIERLAGREASRGRIILAHLGSGASMAAVRDGRSIDTTMAFTPTAGLVMATRCGDLDPGFLLYVMRTEQAGADAIDELVNSHRACWEFPKRRPTCATCSSGKRAIRGPPMPSSSFATRPKSGSAPGCRVGGLDLLVFSGGIGENSVPARARICEGLEFLGLRLDPRETSERGRHLRSRILDVRAGDPHGRRIGDRPRGAVAGRPLGRRLMAREKLAAKPANPLTFPSHDVELRTIFAAHLRRFGTMSTVRFLRLHRQSGRTGHFLRLRHIAGSPGGSRADHIGSVVRLPLGTPRGRLWSEILGARAHRR